MASKLWEIELEIQLVHVTQLDMSLNWRDFSATSPNTGADWDVDAAARHITAMFVACNRTPNKLVYHHYTTATDTHNVRVVFHVVMDTIIKENLEAVSLL